MSIFGSGEARTPESMRLSENRYLITRSPLLFQIFDPFVDPGNFGLKLLFEPFKLLYPLLAGIEPAAAKPH